MTYYAFPGRPMSVRSSITRPRFGSAPSLEEVRAVARKLAQEKFESGVGRKWQSDLARDEKDDRRKRARKVESAYVSRFNAQFFRELLEEELDKARDREATLREQMLVLRSEVAVRRRQVKIQGERTKVNKDLKSEQALENRDEGRFLESYESQITVKEESPVLSCWRAGEHADEAVGIELPVLQNVSSASEEDDEEMSECDTPHVSHFEPDTSPLADEPSSPASTVVALPDDSVEDFRIADIVAPFATRVEEEDVVADFLNPVYGPVDAETQGLSFAMSNGAEKPQAILSQLYEADPTLQAISTGAQHMSNVVVSAILPTELA